MQIIRNLGEEEARRAIEAMRAELGRRGATAVVAVADAQGELVALWRCDGAPASSIVVAANKAWTAARLRRPSRQVGRAVRDPAQGYDIAYYGDPRYVGFGGGLPALSRGAVVGAVSVSGLSEDDDEAVAAMGLAALGLE